LASLGVSLEEPMERSVHDSFSLFDLESDLFGESTTHEVHNEHTLSDRKHQLIDPWDPGVWAPKDEESVWEEFSFDQDVVPTLKHKVCEEVSIEGIGFERHDLEDKSELFLHGVDFDQRPRDEDETKFEEEAQETWGNHGDTIVRYEGNSDFYMHHNNKSLNLRGLDINEETWKKQLMVLVENEVQTLSKLDDMKSLVENLIQKTPRNQYEQIVSLVDLQNIKSTIGDMKSTYLNMIKDRDVATKIAWIRLYLHPRN
jgi:hypothetical protein